MNARIYSLFSVRGLIAILDMKKITLALVTALVCGLGFASSAHAEYSIVLDDNGANGNPSWSHTTGLITVRARINGVWKTTCKLNPSSGGWHWCNHIGDDQADDIEKISISTNSTDGFWLDQFYLLDNVGYVDGHWGVNNNTGGWCFSSDPSSENPTSFCPFGWVASWTWST